MAFPLDDNFIFGDNFFTHQQTKLLIQRKHHYFYDMTFLCPPLFLQWTTEKYGCHYHVYIEYICFLKKWTWSQNRIQKYGCTTYKLQNKIITIKKILSRLIFLVIPFRIFLGRDNFLFLVIIVFYNPISKNAS